MTSKKRKPKKSPSSTGIDLETLRNKAISLYQAEKISKLEPVCRKILKKAPGDAYANYLLGLSLQKKGNNIAFIDLFVKAAETDSNNKIFVLAAANALSQADRSAEAIFFFKQLLSLQPNSEATYNQIGLLYISLGRVKDAIPFYKKALKLNPNFVECLNNIGNAFQELGKKRAAISFYRKAIKLQPDFPDAHYNLHAVVFQENEPAEAIEALRAALIANPNHIEAKGYLAMMLDLTGKETEASSLFSEIDRDAGNFSFLQESWEYIKKHRSQNTHIFSLTLDSLRYAFSHAKNDGMILEFGVRYGTTINFLAGLTQKEIHGFDSFEGIPEKWKNEEKGKYTTYGVLPPVYSNVTLHQGWFEETLADYCKSTTDSIRLINVDCDLYSSTHTVFEELNDRIKTGSVIVFDEYICNPRWQDDEFKAFQEYVNKNKLEYEYLLFSPFSKQAAVIIK